MLVCLKPRRRRKSVNFIVVISFLVVILFVKIFCNLTIFKSSPGSETLKRVKQNRHVEYPFATNYDRKDWHDYAFIAYEKSRIGPGEHGQPVTLTDPKEIEENEKLKQSDGLSAVISDKISVLRSVPDVRLPQCKAIQYLKHLPTVSMIIIFRNEWLSVLLRTVHSIYNRTPHELLLEIILVNDASTKLELYGPLEQYVKENFDCVQVVHLKERSGLIVARMEGARRARGEVLTFADAHMEFNVNWLPPLLEPIAINPRTMTTPRMDTFSAETFEYFPANNDTRGVFGWNFHFRWIPRLPKDFIEPEKPAETPIILGCTFAIRKDYFFDLGGYDEGLMIWNGEHFEISLKTWLCGGRILEVPCSRAAHTFRMVDNHREIEGSFDYVTYNFKRVAEVWLDDFKDFLYRTDDAYYQMDPGDLTVAKEVKKALNCKPFNYYLEHVAPDMLIRYPYENRGVFTSGVIQSEADPKLCVDTLQKPMGETVGLQECVENKTHPFYSQDFMIDWHRHLKLNSLHNHCLNADWLDVTDCDYKFKHQLWYFNLTSHQLQNLPKNKCLTANLDDRSLKTETCDDKNINQKWLWGYTNVTAIKSWDSFGVKMP